MDNEYLNIETEICKKCGCCEMEWVECWNCGGEGGRDGEELMMEDPLWYSEDDFEECDICNGKGGWNVCIGNCDDNGKHITPHNNATNNRRRTVRSGDSKLR